MLYASIKLYLIGYAKGIIRASYCITNVFLGIKIKKRTQATHLGTEELKHEQVRKYHGVINRDWDIEFHI